MKFKLFLSLLTTGMISLSCCNNFASAMSPNQNWPVCPDFSDIDNPRLVDTEKVTDMTWVQANIYAQNQLSNYDNVTSFEVCLGAPDLINHKDPVYIIHYYE